MSQLLDDGSEFYSQSTSPNTFNKANSTVITSCQQATSCEILVARFQYSKLHWRPGRRNFGPCAYVDCSWPF